MLTTSDRADAYPASSPGAAISLHGVGKSYRLYANMTEQFLDVMNVERFAFWRQPQPEKFHHALKSVDLMIRRGERVGVIGRNGAGKTTLLKLISGAAQPTTGTVAIGGNVQALMQVGVGFHPDFTGIENIRASLLYSGLTSDERAAAEAEITEFVELGDYLNQPLKTYSLGMQSRLQFACATAIKPEILIVDEILGAGDAYFSVKSSMRMEKLTKSGCTLLLVSHSMQQVIQFCERVIWIDGGRIRADGPAREIVTDYESFMFKLTKGMTGAGAGPLPLEATEAGADHGTLDKADVRTNGENATAAIPDWYSETLASQMSGFDPQASKHSTHLASPAAIADDGWLNDNRLRITKSWVSREDGIAASIFQHGEPLQVSIAIEAQQDGEFDVWYVVLIYGEDGKPLSRHVTERNSYKLKKGDCRLATLRYQRLLLGRGEYHASVAIYRDWKPDDRTGRHWYQIMNRSIDFQVTDLAQYDPSIFAHPAQWVFDAESEKL